MVFLIGLFLLPLHIGVAPAQVGEPRTAIALYNKGKALHWAGEYADAETLFRQALAAARLEQHAPLSLARIRTMLGIVLMGRGKLYEAEPYLRKAVAYFEAHRETAEQREDLARSLNALRIHQQKSSRLDEAEAYLARNLEIRRSLYGEDHEAFALALHNLALLRREQDRDAEALPMLRRVVDIAERTMGRNHPHHALFVENLAGCLKDLDRADEALPHMREAHRISAKLFARSHPDHMRRVKKLAKLLHETGALEEAEVLYRQALETSEDMHDTSSRASLGLILELARVLKDIEKDVGAERYFRLLVDRSRAILGEDHPDHAAALVNLADFLQSRDCFAEMGWPLWRALAIQRRVLAPEDSRLATTLDLLGLYHCRTTGCAAARPFQEEALAISREALGDEAPLTRTRAGILAYVLRRHYADDPVLGALEADFGSTIGTDGHVGVGRVSTRRSRE